MLRLKSLGIYFGLFLSPILLMLLLAPFITSPVTSYLLNSKGNELIAYDKERNALLDKNIISQLPRFKFDCGIEDMKILRNPDYYDRHIRLAGIQSAHGESCSTLGPGISIIQDVADMPSVTDLGISTTIKSAGTEQEYLIYSKHAGNIVYWVVNNSTIYNMLLRPCSDCFYLEFSHFSPGLEDIYLPRGNSAIKNQANSISISMSSSDNLRRVEKTLWAGDKLRNYAIQQIRYYGLLISSVFGILLAIGYLIFHNHSNSLGGLLKSALERKEFIPFYQPIIDSRTNDIVGYEALIRWQRGGELIPPGIFIDYAESQGLIIPMTTQLVSEIVADLPKMSPKQWVSVNLVAAHIERPHLQDMLMKMQWPDPERLTFEITERIPISDVKSAAREIAKLGLRGYHFKIDDFGTGYGGFAYLQQLGIRCIKIDKMFIDTIGTSDLKRSVLDAIIAFGRESKMEMIAEGVETQEQLTYLAERGVFFIQGYVYAKPMPINQVLEWAITFKNKQETKA